MEVIGIEMPGKGELADAKWPADLLDDEYADKEGPVEEEAAGSSSTHSEMPPSPKSQRRYRPSVGEEARALEKAAEAEAAMMARLADRLAADASGSSLVLIGWSMGGCLPSSHCF